MVLNIPDKGFLVHHSNSCHTNTDRCKYRYANILSMEDCRKILIELKDSNLSMRQTQQMNLQCTFVCILPLKYSLWVGNSAIKFTNMWYP